MCAIFGFVARTASARPSLRTLGAIVRGNECRGPHAFGLAWVDARGRLKMYKQTGRLTDALGVLHAARDASMLVGHLRFATHGDAGDNINNHPHPADGGWLVHNGVVHNYRELVRAQGLMPVSECDSEVLGLLVERSGGTLTERCHRAVRLTSGNLAMLGLWARPATLVAARRGNPLHASLVSEGLYLATLADGLPGRPTPLRDDRVLHVARRGGKIVTKAKDLPAVAPAPAWGGRSLFGPADRLEYCGG